MYMNVIWHVQACEWHCDVCHLSMWRVKAPGEAEAQCAALARAGKVYGTATEDMDCLTFGSTVQLRHLTASESKWDDRGGAKIVCYVHEAMVCGCSWVCMCLCVCVESEVWGLTLDFLLEEGREHVLNAFEYNATGIPCRQVSLATMRQRTWAVRTSYHFYLEELR